ncbi:MAG: hypothetical protein MZV63_54390 [Marinilabiliales bacterium]|nr:hypothetical protein [Marinilabiliales bacterium]
MNSPDWNSMLSARYSAAEGRMIIYPAPPDIGTADLARAFITENSILCLPRPVNGRGHGHSHRSTRVRNQYAIGPRHSRASLSSANAARCHREYTSFQS